MPEWKQNNMIELKIASNIDPLFLASFKSFSGALKESFVFHSI